jgi:hypothetical protein
MMTFYKKIILSALLLVLTFACKKKDEKPSTNQLLTNRSQKTWIRFSEKLDGKETLKECDVDDEWIFSNDKDILMTPGFLRCDLYEEDVKIKFFLGGPNNETIYFTTPDSSYSYYFDYNIYRYVDTTYHFTKISKADIIELTENSLKFEEKEYSTYGDKVTTTVTSLVKK